MKLLRPAFHIIFVAVFLGTFFLAGKCAKRKWIVYKTLHSLHWQQRVKEMEGLPPKRYKAVFLGNSLTEMFDLNYFFKSDSLANFGIVGDFSEGLLQRVNTVIRMKPAKLFIEIGINDMIEQVPLEQICSNYKEFIDKVQEGSPSTEIFIQSNLPVYINRPSFLTDDREVNSLILLQNRNLCKMAKEMHVGFIDIYAPFRRSGYLKELLIEDGVHLTPKAYALWSMAVTPYLETDSLR